MTHFSVTQPSKKCIVCGMKLQDSDDFPGGDTRKDYCRFCGTHASLHSYEDLVNGMARYIVLTQGLRQPLAKMMARRAVDNSIAAKTGRIEVTMHKRL